MRTPFQPIELRGVFSNTHPFPSAGKLVHGRTLWAHLERFSQRKIEHPKVNQVGPSKMEDPPK